MKYMVGDRVFVLNSAQEDSISLGYIGSVWSIESVGINNWIRLGPLGNVRSHNVIPELVYLSPLYQALL